MISTIIYNSLLRKAKLKGFDTLYSEMVEKIRCEYPFAHMHQNPFILFDTYQKAKRITSYAMIKDILLSDGQGKRMKNIVILKIILNMTIIAIGLFIIFTLGKAIYEIESPAPQTQIEKELNNNGSGIPVINMTQEHGKI